MAVEERTLADIAPVWHNIATLLRPKDLCSCIQACKQLRELSDVQVVWKGIADRIWQELADPDPGGYSSHKALVLDDNRQNVVLAMPLPSVSCDWRYQRPSMLYYQCRLLELQWWRSNNTLRLYFDARGELDLRSPITSSMAVVTLKDQQQQRAPVTSAAQAADCRSSSNSNSNGASAAAAAGGRGQQQLRQLAVAAAGSPSCWSEEVAVFHPDECQLLSNKRGHYKGVLIWSSHQCSQVLELLMQAQDQHQHQQHQHQQQPLPQHMHQQRARRSEAFEEWADWELSNQQQHPGQHQHDTHLGRQAGAGSSSSSAGRSSLTSRGSSSSDSGSGRVGWRGTVGRLLSKMCGRQAGGSSGAADGTTGDAAVDMSGPAAVSSAKPPQRALVFCYANNLDRYFTHLENTHYGLPDYSIAPLLVLPADSPTRPAATAVLSRSTQTYEGNGLEHHAASGQQADVLVPLNSALPPPAAADGTGAGAGHGSHHPQPVVAPNRDHNDAPAGPGDVGHGAAVDNSIDEDYLPGLLGHGGDDPLLLPGFGPDLGPPVHALDFGYPGLLFPHMPGPAPYNMRSVNHINIRRGPPGTAAVREGRWAAEWCKLPGAAFAARGELYDQLQHEGVDDERVRWADLPEAVKRRGRAWWV